MTLVSQEVANRLLFPDTRQAEKTRAQQALLDAKSDVPQLVEAQVIMGMSYALEREPQLCEQAFGKAFELIQSLRDEKLAGEGYQACGDSLHVFCKEYTRSITYYQQAATIFESLTEVDLLVKVLSQMAYACAALERRDDERRYLSLASAQPSVPSAIRATLLERMAMSLSASGQNEDAIKVYEQALTVYEVTGYKRYWRKRLETLAGMYTAVGDLEAAKRTLERT